LEVLKTHFIVRYFFQTQCYNCLNITEVAIKKQVQFVNVLAYKHQV